MDNEHFTSESPAKKGKRRLYPVLAGLSLIGFAILAFSGETYVGAFLTYSMVFLFGAFFPAVLLLLSFLGLFWIVSGRFSLPGKWSTRIGFFGFVWMALNLCGHSYVGSLSSLPLSGFSQAYLESLSRFSSSLVRVENYSAMTSLGGGYLGNGFFFLLSSFLGMDGTTILLSFLLVLFFFLLSYRLIKSFVLSLLAKGKNRVTYTSPYQNKGEKAIPMPIEKKAEKTLKEIEPELTKPLFRRFSRVEDWEEEKEESPAPSKETFARTEEKKEIEKRAIEPERPARMPSVAPAVVENDVDEEDETYLKRFFPKSQESSFHDPSRAFPDKEEERREAPAIEEPALSKPLKTVSEEPVVSSLPLKTAPVVESAPPELEEPMAPVPPVKENRPAVERKPLPVSKEPSPSRPKPVVEKEKTIAPEKKADKIVLDSELERKASQRARDFSTSYKESGATFELAEEGTRPVDELLNPLERQAQKVQDKKKFVSTPHEFAVESVVEEKKEETGENNAKVEEQLKEQQYFEEKRRRREEEERRKKEEEDRKKAEVYRYVSPVEKKYGYPLPDDSLLEERDDSDKLIINNQAAQEKAKIINRVFDEFHIQGKAISFTIGASVTRFNIQMEPGVKSDKINSVLSELQIALNGDKSVRIETVVEGRTTSGIEIGNAKPMAVPFKEAFQEVESHPEQNLLLPIGKDISGKIITFPLDDMPHLLVAGTTGSGKSVLVHSLIMTLLMRNYPSQLKLMLIDPKKVEFAKYALESHLFCPVISEAQQAIVALSKLCEEMDRRYEVLSRYNCVKVQEYRAKRKGHENEMEAMPTIVCVIDEFADLMQTGGAEVADSVQRISQKARACGIHLIIATQRPSKDVIPMVIKSNIACRIGLSCSTAVDSRVILDEGGAETLLGKGDLLFKCPGSKSLIRAQSPFISSTDIENILSYIKSHAGEPNYSPDFLELEVENEEHVSKSEAENDLYEDVKDFVMTTGIVGKASLIRNFSLTYAKADQFLARLRQEGIIRLDYGGKYVVAKRRDMEER